MLATNVLTTPVVCNICGSRDYTVLFGPGSAQVNQIVKCNRCGLMYANPRTEAGSCRHRIMA